MINSNSNSNRLLVTGNWLPQTLYPPPSPFFGRYTPRPNKSSVATSRYVPNTFFGHHFFFNFCEFFYHHFFDHHFFFKFFFEVLFFTPTYFFSTFLLFFNPSFEFFSQLFMVNSNSNSNSNC